MSFGDFDEKKIPFNPILMQTVSDFLEAQKKATEKAHGQFKKFECRRCGDCCLWNYYYLDIDQKVLHELYRHGGEWPHGYWVLLPPKLNLYMPIWGDKPGLFHFDGPLPQNHVDFLVTTGRMHGYWVVSEEKKIVVYNPAPCIHLVDRNHCRIHGVHPQICRNYLCGRYPV